MRNPYAPGDSLPTKVMRRVTPHLNQRKIKFKLDRPLVSFTFDDCPLSALTHGLKPMEQQGWRGSVYIAAALFGITNHHGLHMNADDVRAVYDAGHEIGGHSYSHIDGKLTPLPDFLDDIARNQEVLSGLGIAGCDTFAYPYGEVTPAMKTALEGQFTGLRGIIPKPMVGKADLNQISSTPVFAGADFNRALNQIKALKNQPAWITLFMHDIVDTPSQWGCTPAQMQAVIDAVKSVDAMILPVNEAITFLKGQG